MDQKIAFRHLTKRIAIDAQPLSYRVVSRELGITIQEAKSLLSDFLDEPTTKDRGIVATYCLSGTLKSSLMDEDEMQVDDEDGATTRGERVAKQVVLLVPQTDLQASLTRFSSPPRQHIYALHSTPLASTSDLALHTLPLLSTETNKAKWKDAPLGGYGEIVHPNGERKKGSIGGGIKGKTKASTTSNVKPSTKPEPSTSTKKSADTKSISSFPTTSTAKKVSTSSSSSGPRKIGELGGLFARRDPPASVAPKVVPSKRKSNSPEKSTKSAQNGLFADEELASDEDDEMWDEEAMREAEQQALNKVGGATTATDKKESVTPKKEVVQPKKSVVGGAQQNKPPSGNKPPQQKGLGSFFAKK